MLTAASTRSIQETDGSAMSLNEVIPGDWGGHGGSAMVTAALVSGGCTRMVSIQEYRARVFKEKRRGVE